MASVKAAMVVDPAHGVRLEEGFKISLVADSDLAPDVYAMTLDAKGRPVVTGAGYIKTLIDRNGDGRADEAKLFATTKTGGMGLCFDGNDLLFFGDGGLWKFTDANGDGVADGAPEKWMTLAFGEHGGHAPRIGPDGWWYFIGGNDSKFTAAHANSAGNLVASPIAGAIMRISRDGKERQFIAHGFRNPYDFDFNDAGDIITYDSDVERDFLLPWYTPTRMFHVGIAAHHGWQVTGYMRSWSRPDYYPDAVDVLAPVGRGSPTGVVAYRHTQFPEEYRDSVFILDWTFGKIYSCALAKLGDTYRPQLDLFLEPIGSQGFAPTDAEVAPDGSLLVSIGGRKTRGAVFRIEHIAGAQKGTSLSRKTKVEEVLDAPQPLEAWSRAKWVPAAKALGAEEIAVVIEDNRYSAPQQARAVEIHTELFGALRPLAAEAGSKASPEVRARTAWALSRFPTNAPAQKLLQRLALDSDSTVRRCALEGMLLALPQLEAAPLVPILRTNFGHSQERVRTAAALIAARLPDAEWAKLWEAEEAHTVQTEITLLLAAMWRAAPPDAEEIGMRAIEALGLARDRYTRVDAMRAVMLALGDWNVPKPSEEIFSGYELGRAVPENLATNALTAVRKVFPTADNIGDAEAARLLAMLRDDSPQTPAKMARYLEGLNSPTLEFHYLVCLGRLQAAWPEELAATVANSIVTLDSRLAGRERRIKQNWTTRLKELVAVLAARESTLAMRIVEHPQFGTAGHALFAEALPEEARAKAAEKFLEAARGSEYEWSPALVRILGLLPAEKTKELFEAKWSNIGLREELAPRLGREIPKATAASDDAAEATKWKATLEKVPWQSGLAPRGEKVFRERACADCHGAAGAIGPDLRGVAKRFSKEDLFAHIVFPNREIAQPYRAQVFQMKDGSSQTGVVAFESADGFIVQTGPAKTIRLDETEIASREAAGVSLMPAGLLDGATAENLADLYAYLRSLE